MLTGDDLGASRGGMTAIRTAISAGLVLVSGACVQVQAPERPIEINLNVNVRQEVLLRLERDAEAIIQENPELFPQ